MMIQTTRPKLLAILSGLALGLSASPTTAQNRSQSAFREALKIDGKPLSSAGQRMLSYADAVDAIRDSVVLITSRKRPQVPPQLKPYLNDPRILRMFPQYDPNRAPDQSGLGSGFVVTADGYIITNNHVVQGADEIEVSFPALEEVYPAKIIGRDPGTDIALIKIDVEGLKTATLGDSDNTRVGDIALAIGSPLGLSDTVTMGIISALGRDTGKGQQGGGILGDGGYETFIQTDASINGGNSGGPLVDGLGRVVGVNTFIISGNGTAGGNIGLGFAVPINLAVRIAEDLADDGSVDRGFLGVNMESLTQDMAASFGLDKPDGALVHAVFEGTPAGDAGIRPGDIIMTVDGETVDDSGSLRIHIGSLRPGDKAAFGVLRRGKAIYLPVTLGRKPDPQQASQMRPVRGDAPSEIQPPKDAELGGRIPGVEIADLTAEQRRRLGLRKNDPGILVVAVDPESDAARKGLRTGDLIVEIGFDSVRETETFERAVAESEGNIRVRVLTRGGTYFLVLNKA